MLITPATPQDAHGIATAQVRSWQAAYAHILSPEFLNALSIDQRTSQWQDILQKQASRTLVARRPEGIAGFVSVGPWRDEPASDHHGEIWALYALPQAWGRGVGRALMEAAVHELRSQGRETVWLWVLSQNERGLRFYERFGFQAVPGSAKSFELGGRLVEEVCLRLAPRP